MQEPWHIDSPKWQELVYRDVLEQFSEIAFQRGGPFSSSAGDPDLQAVARPRLEISGKDAGERRDSGVGFVEAIHCDAASRATLQPLVGCIGVKDLAD